MLLIITVCSMSRTEKFLAEALFCPTITSALITSSTQLRHSMNLLQQHGNETRRQRQLSRATVWFVV